MAGLAQADIRRELRAYLGSVDMDEETPKTIMHALAHVFGVPYDTVKAHKAFVKAQIDEYLAEVDDDDDAAHTVPEEREEPPPKPVLKKAAKKKNPSAAVTDEPTEWDLRNKGKGGYAAEGYLSPGLAEFLGTQYMARAEVTATIWRCIKEKNLPCHKGKYTLDDALSRALQVSDQMHIQLVKLLHRLILKHPRCPLSEFCNSERRLTFVPWAEPSIET